MKCSVEYLGNQHLVKIVENNFEIFEEIMAKDDSIGVIVQKVKDLAFEKFFDEEELAEVVGLIEEKPIKDVKKRLERLILDDMNVYIFSGLSISIYNLKKLVGTNECVELVRNVMTDPTTSGNAMLISLSLELIKKEKLE